MINVSVILFGIALCFLVLALWSIKVASRKGTLINVLVFLALVIAGAVVHPLHQAALRKHEAEANSRDMALAVEDIKALNSAFGSPELTLRYLELKEKE